MPADTFSSVDFPVPLAPTKTDTVLGSDQPVEIFENSLWPNRFPAPVS